MVKIENSIFTIKYDDANAKKWLEINCKSHDQDDEIEFSECVLSTKINANDPVIEERIGYKLKFNKNTKYEFKYHHIHLKPDDNSKKKFKIDLYALKITFLGYTKKYTFSNDELNPISAYFTSTNVVEDFERYGGTLSDEIDQSGLINSNEKNEDSSDEMNGDISDKVNEDTTDETNSDKFDQIYEKKVFWTTKNIIVIVLFTVAVIISVLIVAFILRYRQSRHS